MGLTDEYGKSQNQKLLEELYIEEVNKDKQYVIFLFKGFQIRIKIPIRMQNMQVRLKGVDTQVTCWNWDFVNAGIRVVSDNDFSSLIVFYKTAIEVNSLLGMSESSLRNLKSIQ